jgi:hypothetical protein
MAKYSFFEYATQHGFIVAQMADRIARSREFVQIVLDPSRGRVYQAFKTGNPDKPFFEYVIPEREVAESTEMWRRKVAKELGDAWKRNVRAIEEARLARSGQGTTAPSDSAPSKIESSSTDAPPKPASLSGALEAGVPVTPASVPLPSTPASSKTGPISSKAYAPRSQKSGSKSRSSSGPSTASSG